MPDHTTGPECYTEAHLAEALAIDPRVGELRLSVRIEHDTVILDGVVPTRERRTAAEQVIKEHLPDVAVKNLIVVEEITIPDGEPEIIS